MARTDRVALPPATSESGSADELLPMVYEQLRILAAARLARERPGHTLQATSLVHEAFLRLTSANTNAHWDCSGHFFSAASEAMRRILIERARKRLRRQRLVGPPISLDQIDLCTPPPDHLLIALDEALLRLAEIDPESAELIKLRYYGGLTMAEAAQVMDLPLRSAERNWTYGRTWLHRQLKETIR
jgi:RNA polymerase sigma factor (TIGR02999 family)